MEDEKLVQDFAKRIGKNIKDIRKNKKVDTKLLTQKEIAEKLGTKLLTIQRLEKRKI